MTGVFTRISILLGLLLLSAAAWAEVSMTARGTLFYTDDVGVFSATRRLSRDGDPTQPAIDTRLTNKGSDVVFEPDLTLGRSFSTRYGTTTFDAKGQGFLYADHSEYAHGTLRLQAVHAFDPETRVRLRYYYAPNMFLGDNEDRRPDREGLVGETVTSHIWSARVERELSPTFGVRLLARYGLRRYNEEFSQRDTDFWTIGPHLEWRALPRLKLGLSYHYERGLADGRNQPQFEDDVSYVNHYVSADADIEVMERTSLALAFHYERNNWTSSISGDERNGAHEDIYQAEMILIRQLTDKVRIFAGIQRSNRKQSFESEGVKNTNVGIGLDAAF